MQILVNKKENNPRTHPKVNICLPFVNIHVLLFKNIILTYISIYISIYILKQAILGDCMFAPHLHFCFVGNSNNLKVME